MYQVKQKVNKVQQSSHECIEEQEEENTQESIRNEESQIKNKSQLAMSKVNFFNQQERNKSLSQLRQPKKMMHPLFTYKKQSPQNKPEEVQQERIMQNVIKFKNIKNFRNFLTNRVISPTQNKVKFESKIYQTNKQVFQSKWKSSIEEISPHQSKKQVRDRRVIKSIRQTFDQSRFNQSNDSMQSAQPVLESRISAKDPIINLNFKSNDTSARTKRLTESPSITQQVDLESKDGLSGVNFYITNPKLMYPAYESPKDIVVHFKQNRTSSPFTNSFLVTKQMSSSLNSIAVKNDTVLNTVVKKTGLSTTQNIIPAAFNKTGYQNNFFDRFENETGKMASTTGFRKKLKEMGHETLLRFDYEKKSGYKEKRDLISVSKLKFGCQQLLMEEEFKPDYTRTHNKFINQVVNVEKIDNVQGSTAGASAGDFSQYRQMRRKDRYRLAKQEAERRRAEEKDQYQQTQQDKQLTVDLKQEKKKNRRKFRVAKKRVLKENEKKAKEVMKTENDGKFMERVSEKYGVKIEEKKVDDKKEEIIKEQPKIEKKLVEVKETKEVEKQEESSSGDEDNITLGGGTLKRKSKFTEASEYE